MKIKENGLKWTKAYEKERKRTKSDEYVCKWTKMGENVKKRTKTYETDENV